jgi:hypothetical protein
MSDVKTGRKVKWWWVLLGVLVLAGIAQNALNPEQVAAQRAALDAQTERLQLGKRAQAAVQQQLRDPQSLQVLQLRVDVTRGVGCVEYTARNGFGGTNRERAVFVSGSVKPAADHWNKHCLPEMVDVAKDL